MVDIRPFDVTVWHCGRDSDDQPLEHIQWQQFLDKYLAPNVEPNPINHEQLRLSPPT